MPRIAAIDCGTNSIRLLITHIEGDAKTDQVREMRIVRLGQDVDRTGVLAAEAIDRTVEAAREYAVLIDTLDVDAVRFCATSAARDAANAQEFSEAIFEVLGVRPSVLSGDEEARASFLGATRGLGPEPSLVIDLGGGSTEFVVGEKHEVNWAKSFDIGSVRLTERFLLSDPPTVEEVAACMEYSDTVLAQAATHIGTVETVVGVAGSITTIAAHALGLPSYDSEQIHGARLKVADLQAACLSLVQMNVADRRALPFMHHGRADVIGGGAIILDEVLDLLPVDDMVISECDILDGIAWAAAEDLDVDGVGGA